MSTKMYASVIALIILIAFGVRVGITCLWIGMATPPEHEQNHQLIDYARPDQRDYELLAYHLSIGKGYCIRSEVPTARRTPGTSLTLLPVYLFFGHSYCAGRLWFCWLSAITILGIAWIARQCFGRSIAVCSAILLAFYPGHIYYSMYFVSEVPYALLTSFALGATLSAMRTQSHVMNCAAGGCWGAAILTRPQMIMMMPIALSAIVAAAPKKKVYLAQWACQTVIAMLMIAPWVGRNAIVLGKPVLSTTYGQTLLGSHNELTFNVPKYRGKWVELDSLEQWRRSTASQHLSEIALDQMAQQFAYQNILQNLDKLPALFLAKIIGLFSPRYVTEDRLVQLILGVGWSIMAPLVMFGLYAMSRHHPETAIILMLPLVATVLTSAIFWGGGRFRDSLAPLLMLMASSGIVELRKKIEYLRGKAWGERVRIA